MSEPPKRGRNKKYRWESANHGRDRTKDTAMLWAGKKRPRRVNAEAIGTSRTYKYSRTNYRQNPLNFKIERRPPVLKAQGADHA
jgi:hypothetical protein